MEIAMHRGIDGVLYDFSSRELRLCRNIFTMNVNQARHSDRYFQGRYTLTIPASNSAAGPTPIGDGYIESVNLRQDGGNLIIEFETARPMTFTVHETASEYIIRGRTPRETFPFVVVVDPGHGGRDPGTAHNGVVEKDLVLIIAHMVMEHLNQNPNIQAYMTRHTDVTVTNAWRAEFANQTADLYVSIHANATRDLPNVNGIETWFMNHPREEASGFTSRQFADIMQRRLINATGAVDRGLNTSSTLVVLRDTEMPAVILEVGFLTNAAEAARLATTAHQRLIARAIYDGIVEASGVFTPPR